MTNNLYKNTSTKTLQPDWKTGLGTLRKPLRFAILALRVCKRATVESQTGHSCSATVARLQARLAYFRLIFGPQEVLIKFKCLIPNVLETSSKLAYLSPTDRSTKISQAGRPKSSNWFDKTIEPGQPGKDMGCPRRACQLQCRQPSAADG